MFDNVLGNVAKATFFLGLVCVFCTIMIAVHADHSVKDTYLIQGDNGTVCVYNQRSWKSDNRVFCGDPANALQLYSILKGFGQQKSQQPQTPQASSVVTSN